MHIRFKRKTGQSNPNVARRIAVFFITASVAFMATLPFADQIIPALSQWPLALPGFLKQAIVSNDQTNNSNSNHIAKLGISGVKFLAQQVVWTRSNVALLDTPGPGHEIAHVGPHFPLTLLGDTSRINDAVWYHVQWSVPKHNQKGWISATAVTAKSPGKVASTASFDVLSPTLSSYLSNLGLNVGAVAYDLTRQRTYTYNSSTQFITASSMKVPIMLTFLDSIEQQGREPTAAEMALLTTMIENSDNDAASTLCNAVGWTAGVATYMQKIGINGFTPNYDSWGYSTITPQAMVDLLTLLQNGKILNSNHRTLALNLMKNVEPDQRVGVGDTAPPNAIVALKDGWVTGYDGLWAVNSSGIVTAGRETYIISVYTQGQQTLEDGESITRKVCGTVAALLGS
jgi:beta-lactamase class A